ncbi:MAG TPA: exodeoxyribonuclease VII small subunit [Armatimonadota bacterium]|nr:exodeoxyribonuclease VII small subunit [Armatimonadota bacterium]
MAKRREAEPSMSFEDAIAKLESVVDALEGGQLTLEESLKLFQEGMALRAVCEAKLDQAETTIRKLLETSPGVVSEVEFQAEDA